MLGSRAMTVTVTVTAGQGVRVSHWQPALNLKMAFRVCHWQCQSEAGQSCRRRPVQGPGAGPADGAQGQAGGPAVQ